jgi:hypothetical protein
VEFLLVEIHVCRTSFIKESNGWRILMSERAATGEWKDFARDTLRGRSSNGDGDDDVALLVSLLDVPVGFGDPLERVSPVDTRRIRAWCVVTAR